jgi:hypothetical protein
MSARMIGFAATVACIASPSFAADFPEYREGPQTYQRESHTYEREYRRAAPGVTVVPRVVERRLYSRKTFWWLGGLGRV